MWNQTPLTELLNIQYPIIGAPMGGGATTPALAAAVSEAGGLGFLAGGYLSGEQITEGIAEIRRLTGRPFGVNLFIPEDVVIDPGQIAASGRALQTYRDELGLDAPPQFTRYAQPFEEQMAAVLEARVPAFSFTFGLLSADWMRKLKGADTVVLGTATTVREAIVLAESGVDAVLAQGSEAGAHRGTFLSRAEDALVGTMALVPQTVDAVRVPVLAAGGIMDGRGIVAALALGAAGVQMGTAFLTTAESGIHPKYKAAILAGTEDTTALTRAFSGKAARGIRNRMMDEMRDQESRFPPYPIQNALTRDIRQAAGQHDRPEFMSLWAGQGFRLARTGTTSELMRALVSEVEATLEGLRA